MEDLNISHVKDAKLDHVITEIDKLFGPYSPLTIRRGVVHNYLSITLYYSNPGKIMVTMFNYIQRILDEVTKMFKMRSTTPSANHLFKR